MRFFYGKNFGNFLICLWVFRPLFFFIFIRKIFGDFLWGKFWGFFNLFMGFFRPLFYVYFYGENFGDFSICLWVFLSINFFMGEIFGNFFMGKILGNLQFVYGIYFGVF